MTDDLKQYLVIDKNRLDDELVEQASLFYKASDAYEEALAERDALKEDKETCYAELDFEYRTTLAHATEPKIKNSVHRDNRYLEATEQYLAAKRKAGKLNALKESFDHRKDMLKALGQLYASNYFGVDVVRTSPSVSDATYRTQRKHMAEGRK